MKATVKDGKEQRCALLGICQIHICPTLDRSKEAGVVAVTHTPMKKGFRSKKRELFVEKWNAGWDKETAKIKKKRLGN
jgi:hypothetical protein